MDQEKRLEQEPTAAAAYLAALERLKAQLADKSEELAVQKEVYEKQAAGILKLREEAERMRDCYFDQYQRANELSHTVNILYSDLEKRGARLWEKDQELIRVRQELEYTHEVIKVYETSNSWRITAPLRAVKDFFLKLLGCQKRNRREGGA